MGRIQTFLLQGAINLLMNFITDETNQNIAKTFIREKVRAKVKSTNPKWDDVWAEVVLKFFGMDAEGME